MFSFRLPKKLFDITIESWLLDPAGIFDDLTDVLLHVGSHGADAIVVFVVALTGIDVDEVVLDGALDAAWHIIIDGGETGWHAYGFVFAEHGTVGTLHFGIVEVDTMDIDPVFWRVTAENAMKTMLPLRAGRAVAYLIVARLLSEDLFFGLWGHTFLFHI